MTRSSPGIPVPSSGSRLPVNPYYTDDWLTCYLGNADVILQQLPTASVRSIITSPPYFRQRLYGADPGEVGRERSVLDYVERLVELFGLCERVLVDDGTLWLNLGDTYQPATGDLLGVPWRVALELQRAGWVLRRDIIWSKPDPSPEPVKDRPSTSHEYVFLFAKTKDYYYDIDQTRVPHKQVSLDRIKRPFRTTHPEGIGGHHSGSVPPQDTETMGERWAHPLGRNLRSVWEVATAGYHGSHFATFPPDLIKPMILAGCPEHGTILDPFAGSGTVGMVANSLSRRAILIDLYEGNLKQIMLRAQGVPFGL